ncbi:MAG: glycosyltransferase family 4 protein [Geminicoccaceae bacterium]|nr:glycosyltransferase family 4 protein [Geminicoccaceae bacterium]
MRVALLTNNLLPPREGIGRHLVELGRRLGRYGIEPLLVGRAPEGTPAGLAEIEGVPARLIGWPGAPPIRHLRARATLQHWLDEGADGAEILHVHSPLLPSLRTVLPVVLTVHSPMLTDNAAIRERGIEPLARKVYARVFSRRLEQFWLDRADVSLAVSAGVRDELVARYRLRNGSPLVLPNGVDVAFFGTAPSLPREPVVLFVGRLAWRKGLFRLLEAFARLPPERARALVLLGEGPLERDLRARAHRLGIAARVRFEGFVDRHGVRDWLARSAVAVNPADYESGPLTLLEAMAAGTPVVTTPTGLVPELGSDPPVLVVEPTVEALAAGLQAVLASPEEAQARARRAAELVRTRFDWEKLASRLAAIYLRIGRIAARRAA